MLSIGGASRIFLYRPATDMRKSFRGLSGLIYAHLGRPEDGAYYVFANRRRTHVTILCFDGDGLAIWFRRLAKRQFALPREAVGSKTKVAQDRRHLALLIEGGRPRRMNRRFSRENP